MKPVGTTGLRVVLLFLAICCAGVGSLAVRTATAAEPLGAGGQAIHPVASYSNEWKTTYGIHPETFAWLMKHNPGLPENFMTHSDIETVIIVPNGRSIPLWKMTQFLDHNFIVSFPPDGGFTPKQRYELKVLTLRFRKMLAHPKTKHWFTRWRKDQGPGKYWGMRRARKTIPVHQGARTRGNTNGYRIWFGYNKTCFNMGRMGTLAHEMFHCYGNGHNGVPYGLGNGVFAGGSNDKEFSQYPTVDVNRMKLRRLDMPPVPPMPTMRLAELPITAGNTTFRRDGGISVQGLTFEHALGQSAGTVVAAIPEKPGRFVGFVGIADVDPARASDGMVFEVYQSKNLSNFNLARNCPVTASTEHQGGFLPGHIVDGTRGVGGKKYWMASDGQSAWLEIDLGGIRTIDGVRPAFLKMKDNRVERYLIEISKDRETYRLVIDQGGNRLSSANLNALHELEPVEARYVRITLHQNTLKKLAALSELEVLSGGLNIAKGCDTRISTREDKPFPSRYAVDGKSVEGPSQEIWQADPGTNGWIQVDLGQSRTIRHVHPTFIAGKKRSEAYDIAVSVDGKSYRTIVDMSTNTQPSTAEGTLHTIDPVKARYVRVNFFGNSHGAAMALAELEIYEDRSETDPRTLIARTPELSDRCQRWWCIDAAIQPDAGRYLHLVVTDTGRKDDRAAWCNAGILAD